MSGVSAAGGAIASGVSGLAGAVGGGSTLLSLAGTGVGIFGDIIGGIQQRNAYNAQAQGASMEARQVIREGQEQRRRREVQGEELASTQLAVLGASGVDIMGSPLDVIINDRGRSQLGAEDALYSAKTYAAGKRYESTLAKYQAGNAIPGAMLSIGGRLIGAGKTLLGSSPLGGTGTRYDHYDAWDKGGF